MSLSTCHESPRTLLRKVIRLSFQSTQVGSATISDQAPSSPSLLYKSRVRTEPTNVTAPQWTAALWVRLGSLIEEMADCCIKVRRSSSLRGKIKNDPYFEGD